MSRFDKVAILLIFVFLIGNGAVSIQTMFGHKCVSDLDCRGMPCFGVLPFTKEVCVTCKSNPKTGYCGCVSSVKQNCYNELQTGPSSTTEDIICRDAPHSITYN